MRNAALVILLRLALLVAVFASAVLLIEYKNAGDPAFCGVGTGCMAVRLSSYSRFLGVPLPLIGLIAFSALLLVAVLAREKAHLRLLAALGLGGGVAAVVLLYVQASEIKAFCRWCVMVDAGAIVAAIAAVLVDRAASKDRAAERSILAVSKSGPLTAAWLIGAGIAAAIPSLWARYPVIPPLPAQIAALQVPGKLTVVSFTDFQCPFCRAQHPIMSAAKHDHGDRIATVRKMAPLPIHPGARPAALAYLCVPEAQRDEMAHALYTVPDAMLTRLGTIGVAAGLGLDAKTVEKCVDSPETRAKLEEDLALFEGIATKALPLTFIGSRTIMGYSEDRLKGAIALGLAGDQPSLPVSWMIAAMAALGLGLVIFTRREIAAIEVSLAAGKAVKEG